MANFVQILVLVFLLLGPLYTFARDRGLSKAEQLFVKLENEGNNGLKQSTKKVALEYFLIPFEYLEFHSPNNEIEIENLTREINGKKYFLWPIHPTDEKYKFEIQIHLQSVFDYRVETVQGPGSYRTASRSLVLPSASKEHMITVKTSTNVANGNYSHKPMTALAAVSGIKMNDYYQSRDSDLLNTFRYVPESLAVVLKNPKGNRSGDFALLFRKYSNLVGSKTIPIPLFAFFHEEWGERIAKANGYEDPKLFIYEKVLPILAKAAAEQLLFFGATSDSGHSQNWCLRVDEKLRLTNIAELRDFADTHLSEDMLSSGGNKELLHFFKFVAGNKAFHLDRIWMQLTPFQMNKLPSWLHPDLAYSWNWDLYNQVASEVNRIAGTKSFRLTPNRTGSIRNGHVQTLGVFTINKSEQKKLLQTYIRMRKPLKSGSKCEKFYSF